MNDLTKSIGHIDIATHPSFVRLRDQAGFSTVDESSIDAFVAADGLKLAIFADDPNTRKETIDIVVIAPELKKAFNGTLSQTVIADFSVARSLAARWGLRSMPALAVFRDQEFLGAVQGLQNWGDYCEKLVEILQTKRSAPRVIAILNKEENA